MAAWEYGQQFDRTAILTPVIAELRQIAGRSEAELSAGTGEMP
jgi:hypothetical protein